MSLRKTLKATQPSGKRKLNDTRKTTQLPGVCQFDLFIARWVLVLWEEENTLSIVKETSIIAPTASSLTKGSNCSIKCGKDVFRAEVLEIGELIQAHS